ncbi:MAG: DNA-protecting protein DprA [Betaproteobacteria bacterium]|nr:DNA-protecting protein DprA [Betaproteobacteria bacterium]
MNLAQDELQGWLALAAGGLASRQRARRLLTYFGGPLQVFGATAADWRQVLDGERCDGLDASFGTMQGTALRTMAWLAQSPTHHVLHLGDAHYPGILLESPDPPLLLHATGQLESLARPAVALVGSRHATPAGQHWARRLGTELNVLGIEVVSGLAVGIDAAAHEAALKGKGAASTIAVAACGLDQVYPRQHAGLFKEISEAGLVVSEHPLDTPALPAFFPQRNRIIAGLSRAVVVIEAAERSGSLITARLAGEAGRDVFAVPGHWTSPQAAGCNRLIKSGAGLLENVADIIESQPWAFSAQVCQTVQANRWRRHKGASSGHGPCAEGGAEDHGGVWVQGGLSAASWSQLCRLLRTKPCDLGELADAVSGDAPQVSRTLLMAELQGLVARLPGGLYQWCVKP